MIPNILLIEDNPGDSELVTHAIKEIRGDVGIVIAGDGQSGLTTLWSMVERGTPPDLVICNFNLPNLTGAQVLASVIGDDRLNRIPFIMLTSSDRDTDRESCAGAKAYLIKGSTWEDTLGIARQIINFLPVTKGNALNSETPTIVPVPVLKLIIS
jgi:two-component system, chemotaxis family, response regulator Rcp1